MLKPGTRIRLLAIHDPYTRLAAGALGTVKFIDDPHRLGYRRGVGTRPRQGFF